MANTNVPGKPLLLRLEDGEVRIKWTAPARTGYGWNVYADVTGVPAIPGPAVNAAILPALDFTLALAGIPGFAGQDSVFIAITSVNAANGQESAQSVILEIEASKGDPGTADEILVGRAPSGKATGLKTDEEGLLQVSPPAGGTATAANQATQIGLETSLDGKTPPLGQTVKAASVPVTLASDQGLLSASDFFLEVMKGQVTGHEGVLKFGTNFQASITKQDVWTAGGLYPFLTAASVLSVVSDSANDTLAGTGARTLEIQGLDTNFDPLVETVNLNGVTPVLTAGLFLRVFRMIVKTSGALDENDGTIGASVAAVVRAEIQPGLNQTQMAIYTIKDGKTGFITHMHLTGDAGSDIEWDLMTRDPGESFRSRDHGYFTGVPDAFPLCLPVRIPEHADILVRAQAKTGVHDFSATFGIVMVDNGLVI